MNKILFTLSKFFRLKIVRIAIFSCFGLIIVGYFVLPNFYKTEFEKMFSYYYVWQGDKYYKRGNMQEAIKRYNFALRLNPKHVKARYNLANIFVVYEDYLSAAEQYERVLRDKPDFMVARIDYGIVLSEAFLDYDRAIREYETAVLNKPKTIPLISNNKKTVNHNSGVAYYNMGRAYRSKSLLFKEKTYASNQYLKKADESYEKATKYLKNNYNAWYNKGLVNQLVGNTKSAGENYCKAISVSPYEYEAHYNLAVLLREMKQYKYAIEEFRKAGMALDLSGGGDKTYFVYMTMNDANKQMVQATQKDEKKVEDKAKEEEIQNENENFIKEMKKCSGKELFKN